MTRVLAAFGDAEDLSFLALDPLRGVCRFETVQDAQHRGKSFGLGPFEFTVDAVPGGFRLAVSFHRVVMPDGRPREVNVLESSGYGPLDDSAVTTVRQRWRFIPARRGDAPIESRVRVPIRFRLEDARG